MLLWLLLLLRWRIYCSSLWLTNGTVLFQCYFITTCIIWKKRRREKENVCRAAIGLMPFGPNTLWVLCDRRFIYIVLSICSGDESSTSFMVEFAICPIYYYHIIIIIYYHIITHHIIILYLLLRRITTTYHLLIIIHHHHQIEFSGRRWPVVRHSGVYSWDTTPVIRQGTGS